TPPWSLPANKTQSGFLTRSTKGSGANANSLLFEDKQGSERISVHAERDMDREVERDDSLTVGGNRILEISGTHTETITHDSSITIKEGEFKLETSGNAITLTASTSIVLTVGSSSLTMCNDGVITLSGSTLNLIGTSKVHINENS
ncbi:bacteriophage T4 gp5 trimerisation domain-containing protein, partial [Pseudomonas sp. TAA207]|uniref:bacteriophage T4 gp5 trimerisation domain-containing protein n=1 Tax=Pseudomonas sp. TAA207 TaxID=1729582 RepID=UPI000AE390F6